jgi:hypothetical protein
MISMGLIHELIRIMFDSRFDWPSKGSAVSLLQYSHRSLSDADLYFNLVRENSFEQKAHEFLTVCSVPEIKKFIHEAL